MSLQQSNLANYGYDTVVAVTQSGLNGILKTYYNLAAIAKKFTPVTKYFIKNASGNAEEISLAALQQELNNTSIDPLKVTSTDTAFVNTLKNSSFYFAFTFTPGDPPTNGPIKSWDYNYLQFIPGTQQVNYTLVCNMIQLAFFDTDNDTWVNESQTTTLYSINSTITLQNILNTDNDNLPDNIKQELKDLGNAGLSVYQLLFDFDTAVVNPSTSIPGLSNSNSIFKPLLQQFVPAYLNAYNAVVSPTLNYSITQPNSATLMPTSMNFCIEQLVDANGNVISNPSLQQQSLLTLNYLFATGGNTLPVPKQFNWNWIEAADAANYNGAVAINRNTFANYFHNQLKNYVLGNCWIPVVSAGNLYTGEYNIDINYGTYINGGGVQPFNAIDVEMGLRDSLLMYVFEGQGSATGWSSGDTMTVQTHFQLQLDVALPPTTTPFLATTLTLTQSLWILVDATGNSGIQGHTPYNGSPVKKTFIDTLNVIVEGDGNINLTNINAQVQDESDSPNAIPDYVTSALGTYAKWAAAYNFKQVPLTFPKKFVFPGGTTFTYKSAGFSQCSDLVGFITYNQTS